MFSTERDFCQWKLFGFSGSEAKLFECIDSTHSQMKRQAAAGLIPPGALFVANQQDAGRGRHERTWESPANKNLYFNILIPLDGIPLSKAPQVTQVAALTFAEVFRSIAEDSALPDSQHKTSAEQVQSNHITVKWPNDILYGKSKFCGILAEVVYIPGNACANGTNFPPRPAVNMGVGVNVNGDPSEYASLNRAVTTLKEISGGRKINRERLLQALIASLERAIGQFRAFGISPWVESWRKMDQFIGARGTIIVNNRCTDENRNSGEGSIKKTGCILDMQPDGSLLFKADDGTVETVYSADLEI